MTTNRDNVLQYATDSGTQNVPEPGSEPFPAFDLEINKEDKDSDIDNPQIKKDPKVDKTQEEENPPQEKSA